MIVAQNLCSKPAQRNLLDFVNKLHYSPPITANCTGVFVAKGLLIELKSFMQIYIKTFLLGKISDMKSRAFIHFFQFALLPSVLYLHSIST